MKEPKNNVPETGVTTPPAVGPTYDPAAEAEKIIKEAEAKAAQIVADAEARVKAAEAEAMDRAQVAAIQPAAEVKKRDPMEELVDYMAPILPGVKKRDILVGVNGETLRIKRGVPVKIKRKFYNALQNAARQELAAMESREEIKRKNSTPVPM